MQPTAASSRNFLYCQVLFTCFFALAAAAHLHATTGSEAARIASISVPFVANQGQIDSRVAFYAKTFAGTVFVTTDGQLVYSLAAGRSAARTAESGGPATPTGWTLSETFARAPNIPVGLRPAVARISNFVGPAGMSQSDLPTYDSVGLGEIAPGISLELRASGNNVEKLFQVAPGADAKRIRVRIQGAERLALGDDGSLVVGTGLGDVQFTAPVAYQERGSDRIEIPASYVLAATSEYGFVLGAYDHALPLTIDPLIRSTYSGGTADDVIRAMLVHPGSSEVYVAGWTTSTNFPGTTGIIPGAQFDNLGGTDAFVALYNPALTNLVRASYYGGGGSDKAYAIAILPSSGDIYIAGTTTSATGLLNISGTYSGGGTDAFIARFNGALAIVIGARYYGGSGDDAAYGLGADNVAGAIVVGGETTSTDLALGTAPLPPQIASGGVRDAFVARFPADLGALIRASYFGGSSDDRALAVAIDPIAGDVVLAGATQSATLPGTANGALSTNGGVQDGFVARFDGGLTTLRQSSYFGGSGDDQINAVAVHPLSGRIYVTGDTTSSDLRGKPGSPLAKNNGSDAFVARFHQDLTGLQAVSYFGGTGEDFGNALAISKYSGEVYVAGASSSAALPGTSLAIQAARAGDNDAFVARFNAGLTGANQTTFLGGTGSDKAYAVAITDAVMYLAGETASTVSFPGTTVGVPPPQSTFGGGASDGFVSAMGSDLRQANSNPAGFAFRAVANVLPLSVQTSLPALITPTGDALAYVDGQPGSTWCASDTAGCSCERTSGGFIAGSATLAGGPPYYVCVRHTASAAPGAISESTMHIGAIAATFRVGTGAIPGLGCTLDVDGDGTQDALTDGLLILRALFGLTGTAATSSAVSANALRAGWDDISSYLNTNCGANLAP